MHILVTGGAGFIGGHLAAAFLEDGHDVTVIDAMDPFYDLRIKEHTLDRHREVASEHGGAYTFHEADIREAELINRLVTEADAVYHQAAKAGVRPSVEAPREYHEVNVDGTLNLLEAARHTDLERFVVASTSSVYGGHDEYLPFAEDDPTIPVSPYGATKLAAERYATAYYHVYDLPTVVTRYFTVYGPRMRPNMAISNFVSRCFAGEAPVIYGDGRQTRDFTFIDDVVEVNRDLLQTDVADGEALNVGSGERIEIHTLAEIVRDELAPERELEFAERHEADADHTLADISKAGELLGYEPTYTIREGVARFIEWYRANRDWYEPLVLAS